MQIFRRGEQYQNADDENNKQGLDDEDMEVELVPEPAIGSSAAHHALDEESNVFNVTSRHPDDSGKMLEGDEAPGGADNPLLDPARFKGRLRRKWVWAVVGGVAAILLIIAVTVGKVELSSGELTSSPLSACSYSGLLLPDSLVTPLQYDLSLVLTWGHFLSVRNKPAPTTFEASSIATLRALRSTKCLVMHSSGLAYKQIRLKIDDNREKCLCGIDEGCPSTKCTEVITPARGSRGSPRSDGMSIVHLGQEVHRSDIIQLSTEYTGQLGTFENALHRSWGFAYGSETAHLISTKFKESYARQVLPCLDEPQYRAVFALDVEMPAPMMALSTMPIESSEDTTNGTKVVTFEPSPPMATHMLSFCGGRLRGRSMAADTGKMNITAWAPPSLENLGEAGLALDIADFAYEYFAQYTGVQLPLTKIDMVAVPGRRTSEPHWGLMMFDERSLLFNQASEGSYDIVLAANAVCHNMALQWFGGYVTPNGWAQYAMADGVAGLLSYKCMEYSQALLNAQALFQVATTPMGQPLGPREGPQTQALQLAADPLATPLVMPDGESPPPDLATAQGAAFLGMLEEYCDQTTPGAFQAGLQLFLQRHALTNGTMVQLSEAIAEALLTRGLQANLPPPLCLENCLQTGVAGGGTRVTNEEAIQAAVALITPYFRIPGYPAVFSEADAKDPSVVKFQQSAFTAWDPPAGADSSESHGTQEWLPLPVGRLASSPAEDVAKVQFVELTRDTAAIQLPDDQIQAVNNSWLVKSGGRGLFRATYDDAQMEALAGTLGTLQVEVSPQKGTIKPDSLDRLLSASALIDDCFAGMLSATAYKWEAALKLFRAAAASPAVATGFGRYLLLLPISQGLARLRLRLRQNKPCLSSLNAYTVSIMAPSAQLALAADRHNYQTQDLMLSNLAKSDILVDAALAGDSKTARTLCAMYEDPDNTVHNSRGSIYGGLPVDLRGAAYIVAMARPPGCVLKDPDSLLHADELRWQQLNDIREDLRYLYAMPYASNATALKEVLQVALHVNSTVSKVAEPDDAQQVLWLVAANDVGGDVAWQFVTANWDALLRSQGVPLYRTLAKLPLPSTKDQLKKVRAFFAKGGAGAAAPQTVKDHLIGRLAAEIDWVAEYETGICEYLQSQT